MNIVNVKLENREKFIKRFEDKGFTIDKRFIREEIIKNVLPITLDFETKEIGRMVSVTCACVALNHGVIKSEETFWKILGRDFQ